VTNGASVTILKGNGKFSQIAQYVEPQGSALSVVTADFNGDGRAGLAVLGLSAGNPPLAVQILFGNGDATFGAPSVLTFPAAAS
jgi:hypothetical protein